MAGQTLRESFKAIADAIREVEGSSDDIPYSEFPDRIRHLTVAVDFTRLAKAISDATSMRDSAKVRGSGDYDFGTQVTTQAAVTAITQAIATAQGVYDTYRTGPVTQAMLDAAQAALESALSAFNATLAPLTADRSAFDAQSSRHATLKTGVSVSADGKDVAFGGKWVTASEQSAADTALTTARNAVDAAKRQSEIAAAVSAFKGAVDTYSSAIKTATKDTAALDAAVSAANAAKADVKTSDQQGSDLPSGSQYVTAAEMKALDDAIAAATTAKTSAANQNAIDSATSALTSATATFKGQVRKNVTVYGVKFAGFPGTTKGVRTDAAADFGDPSPATGNGSGSSPFDSIAPWSEMKVEDRAGGRMVKIPKFYYKLTQDGNGVDVQIATGPMNGFSVCPACMDRDDGRGEREAVYVGRYHCATSTYKSTTNVRPLASVTKANMRTNVRKLGAGYEMMDFATRFTIWLLYIVEFAEWNSQKAIGYGCGNNSATQNMGYTDSMQYHTGTSLSSRTSYGLGTQYRNIEGLWDNVYDFLDGCYNASSGLYVILNPSQFADQANGKLIGKPSSGWVGQLKVSDTGGFPAFYASGTSGGGESAGTCDYWGFNSSSPVIYVGGYYGQGADRGLFRVNCTGVSNSNADCGCRLLELP